MLRFTLRRLASAVLLLWIVLTATFFLLHLAPGSPLFIYEGPATTEEDRQRLREYYGLDKPLVVQYGVWLGAVARGDWGVSITQQRSAVQVLAERFPNTVILVLGVLFVEYGLGLTSGVTAAARAGSGVDYLIRVISLLFYSVPVFWLGMLLRELFAVRWGLFPVGHMTSDDAAAWPVARRFVDVVSHVALPAASLGLYRCAAVMRFVRNGLLEILSLDYVRTAQAIGLSPRRILWVHALKNALGPLIQRFGYTMPGLLSGTLVVEVVFAWPGIGRATVTALFERDYPVILAATGLSAVLVVLFSLLADLLHATVDPRVRDR